MERFVTNSSDICWYGDGDQTFIPIVRKVTNDFYSFFDSIMPKGCTLSFPGWRL